MASPRPVPTRPPVCPRCGGVMAAVIYGLVTLPVDVEGPYVLAGCCKELPAPTARCEACGFEVFGDPG